MTTLDDKRARMRLRPLIAIDFSSLDHLSPFTGHYRYVVNLVRGLAELRPEASFILLGSRPAPVDELSSIFEDPAWHYRQAVRQHGRGSYYRDHLGLAWTALRERVDLLHVLQSPVPVLAPCPVVVTIYDLMAELFPEYARAAASRPYRIDRWAVRHRARRAIAISATTAADLNRLWGIGRGKIDVVPLGSSFVGWAINESARRESRARFGELCADATVLSPYNLEPRKNLAALLKAVNIVRSQHHKLRLLLFGRAAVTAERERQFEKILAELGLGDAVHRLGPLSDTDLVWLYGNTTMFVFPSLYEGFGLPVLEAMTAGACVIAHNASAMAGIVGKAGALMETGNPAALATMIAALLEAPERRAQLATEARKRSRTFTVERMARLTNTSYSIALDRPEAERHGSRMELQ